jgi:hypothetical protein
MTRFRAIPGAVLALALAGVLPPAPADDPPAKPLDPFAGRTGAMKAKLLEKYGGTAESEKAVELALEWLAKQQQKDGGWEFDQGSKTERAAATGLVLLAFFGAGEHYKDKNAKHQKVVKAGVDWLVKSAAKGKKAGSLSENMYAHGIGTLALAEAYALTKDPAIKPAAQSAVNYLQKAQCANGSWGYASGARGGDMSVTGWQIQALHAAKHGGLTVDAKVLKNAVKFLDFAGAGAKKSMYGYQDDAGARPDSALTAVGLWSRTAIDNWGPDHPGLTDGVTGLMKDPLTGRGHIRNLYFYYYATQVVRLTGGDEWTTWNEGAKGADGKRKNSLRDWLVKQQINKEGDTFGSWDPEGGWFGTSCGRLGTTAVCALTLEVYYRYLPPEKKDDKKAPDPKEK